MRITKDLNIYLWDTGRLAKSLATSRISDFETTVYLILYQIIAAIILFGSLAQNIETGIWFFYELLLTIILIVFGTYRFYLASTRDSHLCTVLLFIVLSVPITIKITLMYHIFLYAQFYLLVYMEIYTTDEIAAVVTMAENIIVLSIFFWRMIVHTKRINQNFYEGASLV